MVIIIFFLNEKNIYKLRSDTKNVYFACQFCLGGIYKIFEYEEISFKGTIYDFSVIYKKSKILIIYKYLMVKNNIKKCLDLLNRCLLC